MVCVTIMTTKKKCLSHKEIEMEFTDKDIAESHDETFQPGNYLCRVGKVLETKSKGGDGQWKIMFEWKGSGKTICWDNLTFGLKSKGIAFQKLTQLGLEKDKNGVYAVDPKKLENLEVNLTLIENDYLKDGSLKVYGQPPTFGYSLVDVPF